eukprot:Protomagalhaensia_wolfi_Nauph_80__3165@NODE_321_length_2792_cov_291_636397_g241_i0_p1_GENE_NODE_321_length_2792_cov_291_636397_g241_i0NODE_321_length_2792_cov_291_636397_g241_i0_p1_ORF_typecomplete_len279_score44_57Peptidase_C12/PF01088_21/2_2e51UCH_C/PF18031_1/3_5e06_NODE_321_length_2792_cov_291_636397_g241_i011601996
MDEWCLIESDPAVFWDITHQLGVEDVQYEEVLDLSEESLQHLEATSGKIYGLIFLFRWHSGLRSLKLGEPCEFTPDNLFFAKQVIQNSCATQALLSILLNKEDEIVLSPVLKEFRSFTKDFDPELCGISLANHEEFRQVHNSFKVIHNLQLVDDKDPSGSKDDPFHYVAMFPRGNKVWLLDGLADMPVQLGEVRQTWWLPALEAARAYIAKLQQLPNASGAAGTEIRFNLIAAIPDQIRRGPSEEDVITVELAKRQQWMEENAFRKHDLLPFLLCALR